MTANKVDATRKWCSISNAIVKKFKSMIDNDKENEAVLMLYSIKVDLIAKGFFTEKDFEDWGK